MLKKLRTVIYHVNDLQRAREWYGLVTGVQPYFVESFYVGFDINGCELGLDPAMDEVKGSAQSVAYWLVENIEESVQTFISTMRKLTMWSKIVGKNR